MKSKLKAQEIVKKVKGKLNNIKTIPLPGNMDIGGTTYIYRKEDIRKLAPYKLFYPNLKHYNKFYKYWRN